MAGSNWKGKNNPWFGESRPGKLNPMYGRKHTKEAKEKMSKTRKQFFIDNPEVLEKKSEQVKEYYEKNPHMRKYLGKLAKDQWSDPEFREDHLKKYRKHWSDPEHRKAQSKVLKEKWKDPEFAERMLEKFRERDDRHRIVKARKEAKLQEVKQNKQFDVMSKVYQKEKKYLKKVCEEIMAPYGLEPLPYETYFYYEEIVNYFRPGWLALDRKRRYGGIDPLDPDDM